MTRSEQSSQDSTKFQIEGAPSVIVSASVLRRIKELAIASSESETGGILLGHDIGKDIEITEASDAGPNAQASRTHFLRDTAYCREFLQRKYKETGADYVGEWHSHVVPLKSLSSGDLGTLVGILIDRDYNFQSFAVLLVTISKRKAELSVYVADHDLDRSCMRIIELHRGKFPKEILDSAPASDQDGPVPARD